MTELEVLAWAAVAFVCLGIVGWLTVVLYVAWGWRQSHRWAAQVRRYADERRESIRRGARTVPPEKRFRL